MGISAEAATAVDSMLKVMIFVLAGGGLVVFYIAGVVTRYDYVQRNNIPRAKHMLGTCVVALGGILLVLLIIGAFRSLR